MNTVPKISIVTPAFNCADFLQQCIESVQTQNYQNFEHIIVDGASTDGTKELLKQYAHLKWVSEPDSGEAEALNKALRMASGDIIGWIGADDRYFRNDVFQHVASTAAVLSGSYVLYGKGLFIDEGGKALRLHIPKNPITLSVVSRWFSGHGLFQPSMFYSKHLLNEMGEFREDLPYGIDYEFWLRISSQGKPFHYIDHILGESREGGRAESKSVTALFETRANEWTKIAAAYQSNLSLCEQVNFWKDYFIYRINSQAQYHEGISLPENKSELLGLAGALDLCNHIAGLREVFQSLEKKYSECEDIYWLLASCLERNGKSDAAEEIRNRISMTFRPRKNSENYEGVPSKHAQGVEIVHNSESPDLCKVTHDTSMSEKPLDEKPVSPDEPNSRLNEFESQPLVSVIIPTFNRPERLVHAVKSVLAQTYESIEVLVINDGGCNVEPLLSSLSGSEKITYLRLGQNQERSHARNMGLKLSRGKYIAYLDDDDQYYPNHVETLVTFLENSAYQVAYSDAHRVWQVKENGQYIRKEQDVPYSVDFNKDSILQQNYIPMLCLMHAKSCIDRVGGFDETLATHEDWDLLIRLSRCYSVHHIKSVTAEFTWRTDGSSTTSQRPDDFLRTRGLIHEKYKKFWSRSHCARVDVDHLDQKKNSHGDDYDCSIIIPVFNKTELTQQCLTQLAKVTDGVSYEVIVVDNNSTDGTRTFLDTLGGDIQVIRNQSNLGFAKACNQGARAARGKYFVFLNNDTIPQEGWLKVLVEEAETDNDIAIVGSKLLFADDTLQHAGVAFSRNLLMPYHIYRCLPNTGKLGNRRRVLKAVTAACMLVKRHWFEEAKMFDEGYKNGFEDIDLCLKIGARGGKVIYQPKSWLYHLESQTPGRKNHEKHNADLFLERWEKALCADEDLIAFEDGVALETDSSDGLVRYVYRSLESNQDYESWRKVADLQRLLPKLARSRGQDYQSDSLDKIRELLREPSGWPEDVEVLNWLGLTCLGFNLNQQSEIFLLRVLQSKEDPEVRRVLAKLMLTRGDLQAAKSHIAQGLTCRPHDGELWNIQGVYHMQCQKFSDAIRDFKRAIQHDGDIPKAQMGLGMAYKGTGNLSEAWNTFKIIWDKDPDNIEAMNWLIRTGTELTDWSALSTCLQKFVERNPANCDMRFALAGVQAKQRKMDEAQSHLRILKLLKPDFAGLEELQQAIESNDIVSAPAETQRVSA